MRACCRGVPGTGDSSATRDSKLASGSESERKLFDELEVNKNYERLKEREHSGLFKVFARSDRVPAAAGDPTITFLGIAGIDTRTDINASDCGCAKWSLESTGWKFEIADDRMDATEIGSPRFSEDLCIVPILFRYENLNDSGWPLNLEHKLFVKTLVYIDDEGKPMVGSVTCWSNQAEVDVQNAEFAELRKADYL